MVSRVKSPPPMTVRQKIADYLSRRDHSEKELVRKLKRKFEPEDIAEGITFAKKVGWIPQTEAERLQLAEKMSLIFSRRKKGQAWINAKLKSLGLPTVKLNEDEEFEKAVALIEQRIRGRLVRSYEQHFRFLISRGFSKTIASQALKKFNTKI
jgi:SOS response regulatory protein OraA/RecX